MEEEEEVKGQLKMARGKGSLRRVFCYIGSQFQEI